MDFPRLTCVDSVVGNLSLALVTATMSFRIYKSVLAAVNKSQEGHPFKVGHSSSSSSSSSSYTFSSTSSWPVATRARRSTFSRWTAGHKSTYSRSKRKHKAKKCLSNRSVWLSFLFLTSALGRLVSYSGWQLRIQDIPGYSQATRPEPGGGARWCQVPGGAWPPPRLPPQHLTCTAQTRPTCKNNS